MVPPAPGRFSTTTVWPSCAVSLSETVRAMMSVPLPGVNGTMNLTVFAGQACAHAAACAAQSARAATDLPSFPDIPVLEPIVTDRKSTRLNSSHGYISYAVFCLKKKKQSRADRG